MFPGKFIRNGFPRGAEYLSRPTDRLGAPGWRIATDAPPYTVFQSVLKLAERPTLSIKLPGFGEFCPLPYPFTQVAPLAKMALEAFGPKRMMWGSDYPPVSSREGYRHSLEFPRQYFSSLAQEEQDWIFGRTAASVWRIT